eukprot:JP440876.1.p3 GENE.JP440876.1~~JP440876.1.p3  ORF type:complete len:68 (+),score=6.88 JP440876.1:125-328(+)
MLASATTTSPHHGKNVGCNNHSKPSPLQLAFNDCTDCNDCNTPLIAITKRLNCNGPLSLLYSWLPQL